VPGIPSALIKEARKRWTRCADADDEQRKRILEAKKFRAGDQWPSAIKIAREGGHALAGVPAQPPRPCLVVDRLSQPVRQTSNTIKNASFGFDVLPNGAGADKDTAEIYKGILRRVQNNSRGESPVEWAADGAIEGGIGWFRLRTDYVHQTWDGDPNDPEIYDQELVMERITNNLTVYVDPSAMRPTRSDAQFMFVIEDLDKDEFKRKYPKADVRGLEEFISTGDMKGWVSEDTIRIAEYWRIEYTNRTFCRLKDGSVVEKVDGGPKYEKDQIEQERIMRVPNVKCDKINAVESLEEYDWVGSRIPIIPILGEELNVDGKVILRGIIGPGMDAQRMVNYSYSGGIEIFALAPKNPVIAAAGQIDNYKQIWDTANLYNYSYLPYDPQSVSGDLVPPPSLLQRDTSGLSAAIMLMQTSEEAIKATTSTGDASLGNTNPNERSGRALEALQQQSDLANSNYPDNVRRALIYAAELMVEVIPKITRKGQILHIMGKDDETEQVMAGVPFKPGPNGVPEQAPPDITPEQAKLKESLYKFYDLNNGRYAVTVSVGKATATRLKEGSAALSELIPHLPPPMQAVLTPEYIETLSFPNAHKMAELARNALPPELKPKEEGDQPQIPPEVQQQMQQMQAALQEAQQAIATDQAKQQGAIQTAQIDAQVKAQTAQADGQLKLQIAQLDAETKLKIAAMDNEAKMRLEEWKLRGMQMQAEIDSREAELARASGIEAQQAEQSHEAGMAQMGQQAQAEQAATGHEQAREMAEMGHAQSLEAQEQAAALQPPPAEGV